MYRLRGKEDVACRTVVKAAIFWCVGSCLARGVFEEKYDAIDLAKTLQLVCFESQKLLKLYVFDAELFDEVSEDTLETCQIGEREPSE